ncbi:stage II sporulation protein [filamentous cyanobacterium CCP5]|nr:stage II sporulation protein [filamentous cyanobacterium CCP5]
MKRSQLPKSIRLSKPADSRWSSRSIREHLATLKYRVRVSAQSKPPGLTRLTFAGGLLFTGVLAAQFALPSDRFLPQVPQASTEHLWRSQGLVRQAVSSLEQARRFLQPAPISVEEADAPGTSSTAEAPRSAAASRPLQQVPQAPQSQIEVGSTIDTNLEMRVAIARNVGSLKVGVSEAGYLIDLDGQNYCNLSKQSASIAASNAQGIDFSGCQLSSAVWLEANGGYVYIGDRWYKGRVLLLNEGGQLTAVNFVLLHDYLSSVVGSEMYVHWPVEALKAQAVAARSYALTHHVRYANRNYDLDNTQRYQAYLGVGKETNTTQQAVAETSGEFISYNGGIVESLYAASDQIVQEAHSGQGMSQTGAMQLASQGYSYEQILATYYPSTGLSRLVVE